MKPILIALPWPDKDLSPNARVGWRAKAKAAADARESGYILAKEQGIQIPDATLRAEYMFYPPDNTSRDIDNLLASMKSYVDGIFDAAGMNDRRIHLTTLGWGEVYPPGQVDLRIVPLPVTIAENQESELTEFLWDHHAFCSRDERAYSNVGNAFLEIGGVVTLLEHITYPEEFRHTFCRHRK